MAEKTSQTYDNHTKMVPLYHYVAAPIFLLNLVWAIYRLATGFSVDTAMAALVAVGLVLLFFFARLFALGAQDRVIRLEERLRLHGLLPEETKPRIDDFTTDQLVALRFASDNELPSLAQRILDEGIGDRKVIKQMIVSWRADSQRL